MHEDAMYLGNLRASLPASALHKSKISKSVAIYNAGDMGKIARIDERKEECRK